MKCSMRNAVRLRLLIGVLVAGGRAASLGLARGGPGRHDRFDGRRGPRRQHDAGTRCARSSRSTCPRARPTRRQPGPTAASSFRACASAVRTASRSPTAARAAPRSRRRPRKTSRSTWASPPTCRSRSRAIAVQEEVTVTRGHRSGVQLEPHRRSDLGRPRGNRAHPDAERPDQRRHPPDAAVERQQLRRRRQPDEQHHGGRLVVQQLVRPGRPARRPHRRRADLARSDRADSGQRGALRRAAGQLHRRRREHRHAQRHATGSAARSITASAIRTGSAPKPLARWSIPARSRSATPAAGRPARSSRTSGSRSATTRTRWTSGR